MSANRETAAPRPFGAVLCAESSLPLLVSSLYLYVDGRGGGAAAPLLFVGLGLAAVKSFGRR